MKFSKLCWLILGVLLVQTSGQSGEKSEAKTSRKLPLVSTDEVLWWLPEDTELVAVEQNSLLPTQKPDTKTPVKIGVAAVALNGAGQGKFAPQLAQIPILQIIEGSRKFRDTRGFGLMPYEGCGIIQLQSDLPQDHVLRKWLAKNAGRTEIIAGYKTFIFDEKLEQDQRHFFIAQPRPNLLLYATNKSFLESVLRRRLRTATERVKTVRALRADLPEWKYVDTQSSEWALCHYRKDQARRDPTSPFAKGFFLPDESAVGLTYSLNAKGSTAKVCYLTAPRNTARLAKSCKEFWTGLIKGMGGISGQASKWRPQVSAQPGGIVEMKFSFAQPTLTDTAGMFAFGLLALMGHAIIV